MEIRNLISNICNELEDPSSNKQRKRYLEGYLKELLKYNENHPDEVKAPSALELYCDSNPDAPECKIYDD